MIRARQLLDECPADLRGWEFGYLDNLCSKTAVWTVGGSSFQCLAFSPDGKRLACGGQAERASDIKVYDVASGEEIASLAGHTISADSVAFSPDGRSLASAGNVGVPQAPGGMMGGGGMIGGGGQRQYRVMLWNVQTAKATGVLPGPHQSVRSLTFSSDGRQLATADLSDLQLWDVQTGNLNHSSKIWLPTGSGLILSREALSPDGKLLARAKEVTNVANAFTAPDRLTHGKVYLCDMATGSVLETLPDYRGLTGLGKRLVQFSPGMRGYEIHEIKKAARLARDVVLAAFNPDASRLVTGGAKGTSKSGTP